MSALQAPEPCVASYRVQRAFGTITVFAIGLHRTSGYFAYLTRESGDEFPPRFSLWHVQSGEPALYAVTPFSACLTFQTTRALDAVEIRDARGLTMATVEELSEGALTHTG